MTPIRINKASVVAICVLTIAAVVFVGVYYYLKVMSIKKTEQLVRGNAMLLLHQVQNQEIKLDLASDKPQIVGGATKDAWGRNLIYSVTLEPEVLVVDVTSNGPDGIAGTGDDITAQRTDYNKSRIVGKWIGSKLKQAGDGVIEGVIGKSTFDEVTEEQRPEVVEEKNGLLDKVRGFFSKDI